MTHVGDVHNTVNVISRVRKILFKHVLHNVSAEVSDVREMVNGRPAGVHADLALLTRYKFFSFSCK